MHHACVLARIRLTRMAAERGPILSGACGQVNGFQSLVCTGRLCSSPRSEHGILGKRRVKLRSPAVGRTPRGCQPDEQIRPRLSGTLWSAAVRVRGSRAQRRGRGTTQLTQRAQIRDSGERHLFTSQPPPRIPQSLANSGSREELQGVASGPRRPTHSRMPLMAPVAGSLGSHCS